jgi:DNA processing protein
VKRPVGVVGKDHTRAATPHGLADAREIAGAAARAGYVVVSGLAIGIDTAAHEGALAAGGLTIGVVATGVDVMYPRRNAALFDAVRAAGLVVGEYGFGTPPERWRFPVRNRIIAALGAVTVVVEAKARGGALVTARLAMDLHRDVLAVPGSRRNGSAAGTNALLRDGAHVLTEPADLFVALGRAAAAPGAACAGATDRLAPVPLSAAAASVLDACGGEPCTLDEIVTRSALPPATVAGAIRELERVARMQRVRGLLWPT